MTHAPTTPSTIDEKLAPLRARHRGMTPSPQAIEALDTAQELRTVSRLQQRRAALDVRHGSSTASPHSLPHSQPRPTPEAYEAIERCLAGCKVPARYLAPAARTGEELEAMERMRSTAGLRTGAIVLLCGGPGTGKTSMACELILEHCRKPTSAVYVRAKDLLEAIQATFGGKGQATDVLTKFAAPALLVVDEWHRRGKSDWAAETLWNLVDRRYAELRQTVIVSNGLGDELAPTFDAAMWDRINEDGGVIECDWQSHRETGG